MLNMALLFLLVEALLGLSPVCLQNVPVSIFVVSKAEACCGGSESPGPLTRVSSDRCVKTFSEWSLCLYHQHEFCAVSRSREKSLTNQ